MINKKEKTRFRSDRTVRRCAALIGQRQALSVPSLDGNAMPFKRHGTHRQSGDARGDELVTHALRQTLFTQCGVGRLVGVFFQRMVQGVTKPCLLQKQQGCRQQEKSAPAP